VQPVPPRADRDVSSGERFPNILRSPGENLSTPADRQGRETRFPSPAVPREEAAADPGAGSSREGAIVRADRESAGWVPDEFAHGARRTGSPFHPSGRIGLLGGSLLASNLPDVHNYEWRARASRGDLSEHE
jgi:hypothetical protein